jgi:hypothetical protein
MICDCSKPMPMPNGVQCARCGKAVVLGVVWGEFKGHRYVYGVDPASPDVPGSQAACSPLSVNDMADAYALALEEYLRRMSGVSDWAMIQLMPRIPSSRDQSDG